MQAEDYTFVTLDSDDFALTDAVVVDVDEGGDMPLGAVVIDEGAMDSSDFITLSDDTVMMSDMDMSDVYSMDIDGDDISFMI